MDHLFVTRKEAYHGYYRLLEYPLPKYGLHLLIIYTAAMPEYKTEM